MAALLVAIAVLSVMLIVALPTWRHLAQREKEAELIFRGEQYARAIGLYQRKLAGALPPSLDILVEQKFLRQKYKDPITGEDFLPVYANSQAAMMASPNPAEFAQAARGRIDDLRAAAAGRASGPGPIISRSVMGPGGQVTTTTSPRPGGQVQFDVRSGDGSVQMRASFTSAGGNGIVGVMSKSKAESIRLYNGRNRYDQWVFTYISAQPPAVNAPGLQRGRGPVVQPAPGLPPPSGRGRGGQ